MPYCRRARPEMVYMMISILIHDEDDDDKNYDQDYKIPTMAGICLR